jgi:hypothetical protein
MSLPRVSSILKTIYLSSTRMKAALTLYSTGSLTQSELIMLPVLQLLTIPEQATARRVCRSWRRIDFHIVSPTLTLVSSEQTTQLPTCLVISTALQSLSFYPLLGGEGTVQKEGLVSSAVEAT